MRRLKFWGTRGSCPVSGPEYIHFGGNTPSVEFRYDDLLLIFDAGTGIRPLGATLKNEKKIHLFLSHFHWDHIIGFPFFEPIYRKEVELTIWTPKSEGRTSRDLLDDLLAKEFFPIHLDQIQAKLHFKIIEEKKPLSFGPVTLDFHLTRHPGHTLCFKIKTPNEQIGYVTDNEVEPKEQKSFIAFYEGADLFIHEAQYAKEEYEQKKGWGHSSLAKVIEMIHLIRPGKWLVTHHDPKHSDKDLKELEKKALSSSLPCPAEWIGDGHTIDLIH